jgi:hypothetical protein
MLWCRRHFLAEQTLRSNGAASPEGRTKPIDREPMGRVTTQVGRYLPVTVVLLAIARKTLRLMGSLPGADAYQDRVEDLDERCAPPEVHTHEFFPLSRPELSLTREAGSAGSRDGWTFHANIAYPRADLGSFSFLG